jgi:hypothetical protein
MAGSVSATGALVRRTLKPLAGTTTPGGALTRRVNKLLSGATTPAGVLAPARLVARVFSGTVTAAGTLQRRVGKTLLGHLPLVGVLVLTPNLVAPIFARSLARVVQVVTGRAADQHAATSHTSTDAAVRGEGDTL